MKVAVVVMNTLAVALLLAGLAIGFGVGVSTDAGFACGTAFHESGDLGSDELYDTMMGGDGESGCDAARGSAKPLPIVLLVLGVVGGVGALFVRAADQKQTQATSA